MNKSKLFLFSIISTSIISFSSAMELTVQEPSGQQGIPYAQSLFNIFSGAANQLGTAYQNVANSPTTEAVVTTVATGTQEGAKILATNAYSAGVALGCTLYTGTKNLYDWAYAERSKQFKGKDKKQQLTTYEALAAFNNNMDLILDSTKQKDCKKNIIKSLTPLTADTSLIIQRINREKGITDNTTSARLAVMKHVTKKVNSKEGFTSQEQVTDHKDIINKIITFSTTEDGQINFAESMTEQPIIIDNEKTLFSELEKAESSISFAISEFAKKYMSEDSTMKAVLDHKKKQKLTKEELTTELEKIKSTISDINTTIKETKQENDQLKEKLENATYWNSIAKKLGLTGAAAGLLFLIWYTNLLEKLTNHVNTFVK